MGAKWVTAGAGGVLSPPSPHTLWEVEDHFSFSQMKQWRTQSDVMAYRIELTHGAFSLSP